MNSNLIFLMFSAAVSFASSNALAANTVKICDNIVLVANINVVKAQGVNISREQSEFEQQGYIVQRCKVDLANYNLRGEALVLNDGQNNIYSFIYRD